MIQANEPPWIFHGGLFYFKNRSTSYFVIIQNTLSKAAFYEDVIQFLVIATACGSEEAQEVNLILEEIPVSSELLKRIAKYMYPGADRGIVVLDSDECIHFSWYGYVKYCDGRLKIDWDNIEVRETPEAHRNAIVAAR